MRHSTLQIQRPFGRIALRSLIIIFTLLLLLELLARLPFAQAYLPIPSVGSAHRYLDWKITLMERFLQTHGAVDCIFLGNSTTHRGIDPDLIGQVYAQTTGETIDCFNFGLGGLTTHIAAQLAPVIIAEYKPHWLIYGTNVRDTVDREAKRVSSLIENTWYEYHTGHWSLKGWLIDHSQAFRYWLYTSNWLFPGPVSPAWKQAFIEDPITDYGYAPVAEVGSTEPDPAFADLFANYAVPDSWLESLHELAQVQALGVQLVLVEVPVSDGTLAYFSDPTREYQVYLDAVTQFSRQNDLLFIPAQQRNLIPADGWQDAGHMNQIGARAFSQWLGQQLAQAVQDGRLSAFSR